MLRADVNIDAVVTVCDAAGIEKVRTTIQMEKL